MFNVHLLLNAHSLLNVRMFLFFPMRLSLSQFTDNIRSSLGRPGWRTSRTTASAVGPAVGEEFVGTEYYGSLRLCADCQ